MVRLDDRSGNVTLADALHIVGRHIQRGDDRIQGIVESLHDCLIFATVFGDLGARRQIALHCRLGQHRDVPDHGVEGQLLWREIRSILDHFEGFPVEIENGVV